MNANYTKKYIWKPYLNYIILSVAHVMWNYGVVVRPLPGANTQNSCLFVFSE
jgi:hypothetical protein